MSVVPQFELPRLNGQSWRRSGRALLVFIEADCPTCALTLPYLSRLDGDTDVAAISQDSREATLELVERLEIGYTVLLDTDLKLSRQLDPPTAPTLYLVDAAGKIERMIEGFSKADLNELAATLGQGPIADPHDGAPELMPGCVARQREPVTSGESAPALDIRSTRGERARRIELPADADLEAYCQEYFDDSLPVVPPTAARVERMLAALEMRPDEIIGRIPPNFGAATVEKIAANAVMAGCEPAMMRALVPLVRAMCDERFDLHGLQATTHAAMPLVVVNGPIRGELGFNYRAGVFSNSSRANSGLGRTLRLLAQNLGGARPGEIDMSTLGSPGHFGFCIAEHEAASPWEPFHVSRGFDAAQSALTLFAAEPPRTVSEHTAREAKTLLRAIAFALRNIWAPLRCGGHEAMVVFGPEHAETIRRSGMSRGDAQEHLFENTGAPLREYVDPTAEGAQPTARQTYEEVVINGEPCYRKFRSPDNLHLLVAGGPAGKFSAVMGSWAAGPRGSQMVTYPID